MRLIAGSILILAAAVCLAGGLIADAICIGLNRLNSPAAWGYIACLGAGVVGLILLASGTLEALDTPPRRSARQPTKSPGPVGTEERQQG
jgi:hypothetical protein